MPTGVVVDTSKLESKGFGFIKPDGGVDNLFFHIAGAGNASVQALVKGQAVTYTEGRNNKGVCAENIVSAPASGRARLTRAQCNTWFSGGVPGSQRKVVEQAV